MPIIATRVTVTTSPTRLFNPAGGAAPSPVAGVVKNAGGASVFIGGEGVTTASGFELAPGDAFSADLISGDLLFAVVAAGTNVVQTVQFRS